jgi:NTP pyrophosphatase (non-canonical NTP hydrolase)
VLLEEVDELWDEVRKKRETRDLPAVRTELLQIAAMAWRTALDCGLEERG